MRKPVIARRGLVAMPIAAAILVFGVVLNVDAAADASLAGQAEPGAAAMPEDSDSAGPHLLSEAMKGWRRDAERDIAKVASESFAESLEATTNFRENYMRVVHAFAEAGPSFPGSLHGIYSSRRWARLVELLDDDPALIAVVRDRLRADVVRLQESIDLYGSLTDQARTGPTRLSRRDTNEPLLVPEAMYRANVAMLLAAHAGYAPATRAVLDIVDVLDNDVNWSVAGFTSDRILAAQDKRRCTPEQRAVLREYRDWKDGLPEGHAFKEYQSIELPAFNCPTRPGDCASAMGAPREEGYGTVTFASAPIYTVFRRRDPGEHVTNGKWYSENDYSRAGQELVGMLRRFHAAEGRCGAPRQR